MNCGTLLHRLERLRARFSRLFRCRVLSLRCTSAAGGNAFVFPGILLSSADEIELSLAIDWPMLSCRGPRPVVLRIISPAGTADVETHCRPGFQWRVTHVRSRFSCRLLAGAATIRVEIRSRRRGVRLGGFDLDVLDIPRAQQLRTRTLRAESWRLWYRSGSRWEIGDITPETADAAVLEFTLPATDLGSVLPECEEQVHFRIVSGSNQVSIGSTPARLGRMSLKVRSPPISMSEGPLASGPGLYCVIASIGDRLLGSYHFRVAARDEWLELIEVSSEKLEAETIEGGFTLANGALRWTKHVAFRPGFKILTASAAPNMLVNCEAQLTQGGSILWRGEFVFPLDRRTRDERLPRFELRRLLPEKQMKHVRLLLTIHFDGKPKLAWPIIILAAESASNFEGQLRCDASNFPPDEAGYEEIIAGLQHSA